MASQISSLSRKQFEHLFQLSGEELASQRARCVTATKSPGFPCRVSLADAEAGEEVLLVNFQHQSAATPYQSSYAVYVRPGAAEAALQPNEVPEQLRSRVLSLRGFDEVGMLVTADLAEGTVLESCIEALFANPAVAYIHLHFAKPGCYAARVDRA